MTKDEIAAEILAITGNRYRVQLAYKASSAAKVSRYAVFTGGVSGNGTARQISDPMSHADAQQHRGLLMVADILDLMDPLPEGLQRRGGALVYECRGCGEVLPLEGDAEDYSTEGAYCGRSARCLP